MIGRMLLAGLFMLATAVCPQTASAQFYKGKTVTMIKAYLLDYSNRLVK